MRKVFGKINSKLAIPVLMVLLIVCISFLTLICNTKAFGNLNGDTKTTVCWILVIVAYLTIVLLMLAIRGIFASMQTIIKGAKKLSEGQLNISDIVIWENNDFRFLATAFNDMKSNLLYFIEQTKSNIITLSGSIDKITQGMDVTLQDNENISDAISQVACNAQQQLDLVKNMVAQVEEVYRSVDIISSHIKDVEKIAADTDEVVSSGRECLNEYSDNISVISDSMNSTYDFIEKLRDSINEIVSVIDFIVSISNQLKMLALNASIEAARSGEAGKGFAVVAQQITVLSNQTKDGIERINTILTKILDNSDNVETSINKSIVDFDNGKELFAGAIRVFNDINEQNQSVLREIGNISSEITNINVVTKKSADSSQSVFDSSTQISEKTQDVAAVVGNELTEIEEISKSMTSLQGLLGKIQGLVDKYGLDIKPVNENPSKQVRIAVVCPFGHEFWLGIQEGVIFAKKELSTKNTVVDFYPIEDISEQKYKDTVQKCIDDKYDGIALVGYFEELAKLVDSAVNKGIPVVTFNSEYEAKSKRMTFVGQNAYQSGVISAEAISKKMGGKGRVLVVTSDKSITNHELRRSGFNDTISQNKKITIVDVLEVHDNNDEAYEKVKAFMTKDKDIDGIFIVAGGQMGTAQVVQELGRVGKTKIVLYDFMRNILEEIKKGVVTCAIGQDPFRQGHDPVIYLYNNIVKGIKPPSEHMWTRIDVVDIDNVDNLL